MSEFRIVELVIDENDETSGIEAISVVANGAIESNFVALNKHELQLKEVNKEKRILMGAALIPDKSIYRQNDKGDEYYIYFSKETVRKASELFFKRSNHKNATYEHKQPIEGMTIVESWIVENTKQDKSALYGLNLPVGTWAVSMKVDNDEIYQDALDKKIRGFSIEGFFADKLDMSMQEAKRQETINKLKELLKTPTIENK